MLGADGPPPPVSEATGGARASGRQAGVQEKPLAPMHVWALQAPPCAAVSVLYMLVTEDTGWAGSRSAGEAGLRGKATRGLAGWLR